MMKKSWLSMLLSFLATIAFAASALVADAAMKSLLGSSTDALTFRSFTDSPRGLMFVGNNTYPWERRIRGILVDLFKNETGSAPEVYSFATRADLDSFVFAFDSQPVKPHFIAFGLGFGETAQSSYAFDIFYNTSLSASDLYVAEVQLYRALWIDALGPSSDFLFSLVSIVAKVMDVVFSQLGQMLVTCGLISFIPQIVAQPVLDVRGEVRQYMMSCTLSLCSYWTAVFLMDFALWVLTILIIWFIFVISGVKAYVDNAVNSLYVLFMAGPSVIRFVYCVSFAFTSPESSSRQMFLALVILMMVPMVIELCREEQNPAWGEWIGGLLPVIAISRLLSFMLGNSGMAKQSLSYYFKENKTTQCLLMIQYLDTVIYSVLLGVIEVGRLLLAKRRAKREFGNYDEYFRELKGRHVMTEEALDMEHEVAETRDYAVRISNVCRLFFNSEGEPIPAVNCVSLGVRHGSLFGFLGANGAGKTTLIRMITGTLPCSAGTIEINGSDELDPTAISICPQFNDHLTSEMTITEHFSFFGDIFGLDADEAIALRERFVTSLVLGEHVGKRVGSLSGGNARKLAIAISLMAPTNVVLLDEPTSSLDPLARHAVQRLVNSFRGHKTMMLCTHLLAEAEELCDAISIMLKGSVYIVGSPSYLSAKFGTEWRLDVLFTKAVDGQFWEFLRGHIPSARILLHRPANEIYGIPASAISMSALFSLMDDAMEKPELSVRFFTVSSATLEKVFMELVMRAESSSEGSMGSEEVLP
jgi:ABC-type multidrug transport system ATPase subunit